VTNAADSGVVKAVFPKTAAPQGRLTVFNMSSGQVRVNATPPAPAGGGTATPVEFYINAYEKGTQTLPIGAGYSVTVTTSTAGVSPTQRVDITASETMLEFTAAANTAGVLAAVGAGTLSTPTGAQVAATLTFKNGGVGVPIVKVQIEEQSAADKKDVKYDKVEVGGTQNWTLVSPVKYKITIWIAPAAAGAAIQERVGYFQLLDTSGNISYTGAAFAPTTTGDTTVTVSANEL
jgi:hypothetical protein